MNIFTSVNSGVSPFESAVALGYFDGLHLAHRSIIDCVLYSSKRFIPTVFTFTLEKGETKGGNEQKPLMSVEERINAIEALGVQQMWIPPFSEIRSLTAEEFFYDVLVKRMRAKKLCCGYNFRFGKGNFGDVALLKTLCEKEGIELIVINEMTAFGEPISSTAIRRYLSEGDCEKVRAMLGVDYTVSGEIIHGAGLGRTLNFPTLNQSLSEGKALPKFGVYLSRVTLDGKTYPAITNIGVKPTVGGKTPCAESHIIDFEGDVYGKEAQTKLIKFLREERHFPDTAALKDAVLTDIKTAKKYFRQ